MIKKFLLIAAAAIFIMLPLSAMAETASWTNPTTYTDSTPIAPAIITVKIYEGTDVVCSAVGTSCAFTGPLCGSGAHYYDGTATSSDFPSNPSAHSPAVLYTAPACPPKTPNPPTITVIVKQ